MRASLCIRRWSAGAVLVVVALLAAGAAAQPYPPAGPPVAPTQPFAARPSATGPVSQIECVQRPACKVEGMCTPVAGRCVAQSNADCRRSSRCVQGYCTASMGRCTIGGGLDCRRSGGCRRSGQCTFRENACIAMDDSDCERSEACKSSGACRAAAGVCVTGPDPADAATKVRSKGSIGAGAAVGISGTILAIVGGGLIFGGGDGDHVVPGIILSCVGGSMVLTGVPLVALGATEIPHDSRAQSVAAMAGGTFIAGAIGGMGLLASGVWAGAGEPIGLLPATLSLAVMVGGVGIAWYGATEVPMSQSSALDMRLQVGPGAASVVGTF